MNLFSKKRNSKKYQLIFSSIGLLIAVCFTFVAFGGFAWFSNNKEVSTTGMQVTVKGIDLDISEARYFKYDQKHDTGVEIRNTGNSKVLDLNEYDSVFKDRNKYNDLYIKLTFTGSDIKVGNTIEVSFSKNDSVHVAEHHYISEVVAFDLGEVVLDNSIVVPEPNTGTLVEDTENYYSDENILNYYHGVNSWFANNGTSYSSTKFVNGNNVSTTVTLSYDITNSTHLDNGKLTMFVRVRYDSELLEQYTSESGALGEHSVLTGNTILFENDINLLVVNKREN